MNVAKALGDVLIRDGIVNPVDSLNSGTWPLYYNKMPTGERSPQACVCIYNTGGLPANPKWLMDFPSVQIRVRGAQNGYLQSRDKIQEIKDKLVGIDPFDALDGSGDRVRSVLMGTDIVDLAHDEQNRPNHVLNLRTIVEPAPSAFSNRLPIT